MFFHIFKLSFSIQKLLFTHNSVNSNPDAIKNFCRLFSAQGIPGRININKTSAEVAEDRLETKLETSVKRLGGRKEAPDETV